MNERLLVDQKKLLDYNEQQLTLYRTHNEQLAKDLVDARDSSFWKSLLYFGLGALVTTGIAFGVHQATR
jgi:hypothetical protein